MILRTRAVRALLLGALVAAAASPVLAQRSAPNPFVAEQRRLVREMTRRQNDPRAMVSLVELWSTYEEVPPGETSRTLLALTKNRRLSPAVRTYAAILHADAQRSEGHVDEATRAFDELGFVRAWRVIGPFDNEGKTGFDTQMPPEAERNQPPALEREYPGRERAVRWRTYPDITRTGYVNFDAVMRPYENVCGFAETFVQSERARPLSLFVGSGGAMKVYWNGELVHTDSAYRSPDPDRSAVMVAARAGWNRVLVKACITDSRWGFYLRVGGPDGSPIGAIDANPEGATEAAPLGAAITLPSAPEAPLAALERAARENADDADAQHYLARLLAQTGADDPAEHRARQLSARACELEPNVEHCLFAMRLAETRHERMHFLDQAEAARPDDPEVIVARARMVLGGPDPERALDILERVRPGSKEYPTARSIVAAVQRNRELPEAARATIDAVQPSMRGTLWWLREDRAAHRALGHVDQSLAVVREIVRLRHDDFDARQELVADALERGDTNVVLAHVEVMLGLAPADADTLQYAANVYEGLGMDEESLAARRAVVEMVPDEASAHVVLGRALLHFRQEDAALVELRRALALRPQDAETRELVEQVRPGARPDEAFATEIERILARRTNARDYPVSILHDLRVASVYSNGLGSSFRQIVAQVHDAEGARRWRSFSIPYEPDTQWVTVRAARVHRQGRVLESIRMNERAVGDPRYRIYYDQRALIIQFPDLEPGDTVELRYRVDDIAHRNVFDDYFGDLQILQSGDPTSHVEYVLLAPKDRTLFFNSPRLRNLEHEHRVDGETRIDRFVADDVPALRSEPSMPGITEVAPHLVVSTYRTWEDVGHWWWGLVRDQLTIDESLKTTVADVVRGASDNREKVRRIFDWVVRNTRYVGLEFGIHGYKPYRVTQIVRRGFGDCKDKASLLYVMLREAGVDARIALVRTRHNGAISAEPASLAVFDHAIAYVPEFDLFLDGTAENSGYTELPGMDQGAMTLVVGPDSATLRNIPILPPSTRGSERSLRVELAADGSATVDATETVRGDSASHLRSTYQAEHTRRERLQRALASGFPGVEVLDERFPNIDDYDEPVRYTWRARVPQLAARDQGGLHVPPSSFSELGPSLAARPTRRHILQLGPPARYEERRVFTLPRGGRAEIPAGGEVSSPFGTLSLRFAQDERSVTATTVLEFRQDRIAPSEYEAFRSWISDADALLRQRIVVGGAR